MQQNILPSGWAKPRGYTNGIVTSGRQLVVLGGQIGWNEQCEFETDDFVEQVRQALINIKTLMETAGGSVDDIVRMTWFVTDKQAYVNNLKPLGIAYREVIGRHFPAMSVVQVLALIEDRAKVEIEVTAVSNG